ncbi:MAG: efflux RND transporter periplasmic adaptor subunit [Spartobacteria bacterium]|nr:efflux RND transporter periplasmic adaptor subunit [Spartobacteria bacterium]
MKKVTHRVVPTLTGIALLVAGLLGGMFFMRSKPVTQRRAVSSMIPVVETMALPVADQSLKVDCLGTVIADRSADVSSEVSGRIVTMKASLIEGIQVKKGDVLLEIDDADYRLALLEAEADLLTATSTLRIEEGQQNVVRHELNLMGGNATNAYRDLMLREPQLKVAEASVQRAQLAVDRAKLDLERTKICAPFDAVVVSIDADVGDQAQVGSTLVELAATDRYFVRASVPIGSLDSLPNMGRTPYEAEVTLSDGSTRKAATCELLPDLTEKGRMARILLAVEHPYDSDAGRPLLLNEFVRVSIVGETVERASLIPRKYLRDGNQIWMIDPAGVLHVLPAEVLQGYADEVLIRVDADPKMELITTDLSAPVEGMQLRVVGMPVASLNGN